jgi:predicted Zn-dependent protease
MAEELASAAQSSGLATLRPVGAAACASVSRLVFRPRLRRDETSDQCPNASPGRCRISLADGRATKDRASSRRAEAQDQIVGRLARTLNLEMVEDASRRIKQEWSDDPTADDLAMRGWVLWFRPYSIANRQAAEAAFRQALAINPRSVEAAIGAATILVANIGLGASHDPAQDGARAEQLLLGAIEQDANNSRAHEVLGTLRRIQNRLDESRVDFETAVQLDRNNAHALLGLAQTLMFLGRPADALPAIQASLRLDPRDPNAAFGAWSLGTCYLLLGQLEQASELLRRARADNPRVYYFHIYLAAALGLLGDVDAARSALAEAIRIRPDVNSLSRWTAAQPWVGNLAFTALRARTLDVGLRRAGMSDL